MSCQISREWLDQMPFVRSRDVSFVRCNVSHGEVSISIRCHVDHICDAGILRLTDRAAYQRAGSSYLYVGHGCGDWFDRSLVLGFVIVVVLISERCRIDLLGVVKYGRLRSCTIYAQRQRAELSISKFGKNCRRWTPLQKCREIVLIPRKFEQIYHNLHCCF